MTDQVTDAMALAGTSSRSETIEGMAGLGRFEKCRESELQNRQDIHEPHLVRPAHKQKAEHHQRADHIRSDHDSATTESIRDHA